MAKVFDAPATKEQVLQYLGTEAGKFVASTLKYEDDSDDACEAAGVFFHDWIMQALHTESFKNGVKAVAGPQYNEEFFTDGFRKIP